MIDLRTLASSVIALSNAGCNDPPATADATAADAAEVDVPGIDGDAVDCARLVITGTPSASGGATWLYDSIDAGVRYTLRGVLVAPAGPGPFPAVVVSHGKDGSPFGYGVATAREMVPWGVAVIATQYSHATGDADLPAGADGASPENVLRAAKARELLGCVTWIDSTRVAAHGHSMGAFVTGALVAGHGDRFLAASHTAGGTCPPGNPCTPNTIAPQIRTPYQLHHGDNDCTVRLQLGRDLAALLATAGVAHELHEYGYTRPMCTCPCPAQDHQLITDDPLVLERIRAWYARYGLL